MQFQIYTGKAEPDSRVQAHAEWRIRRALDRWHKHLSGVQLYVQHDHRRCGDTAARCRIVLRGPHTGEIVARGRGSDVERALGEALSKVRRRLRNSEKRRLARGRRRTTMREFMPEAA